MQVLADPVKAFIMQRMARHDPLWRIAASVQANFHIEIDPAEVLACWRDHHAPPTHTRPIQNQESAQIPAGQVSEPVAERIARPAPIAAAGHETRTPPTHTGPIRNQESAQIPSERVTEPLGKCMARPASPARGAATVPAAFGGAPGGARRPASRRNRSPRSAHTGPIQDEESMAILTDEIKAFIVRALARYETPSQVAEAVKANFNIEITRHQVHEYDANCSRPPAQRWRDLHAATRQAFLRDVAEIGIAQKAVRLAMLDRMAHRAFASNCTDAVAAFLEQAAKECGGVYENRRSVTLQLQSPAPEPAPAQMAVPDSRRLEDRPRADRRPLDRSLAYVPRSTGLD